MKSQGNTCAVVESTIDREVHHRKHLTFLKISVGIFVLIILLNFMWNTVMIFNNTLMQEENYKLLEKISQHIVKPNFDDLDKSTSNSTASKTHTELEEGQTINNSNLTISTEDATLAKAISSTSSKLVTSSQQSTSDSESEYTSNFDTTTIIQPIRKMFAVSLLNEIHKGPKNYTCFIFCIFPRIFMSTLDLKLDQPPYESLNFTAYFRANNGEKVKEAKHKVAYFALQELHPNRLHEAFEPTDMITEIPGCNSAQQKPGDVVKC